MASQKHRELPLKEFQSLVGQLTSGKLAKLPVESLPENIPLDFIESAPADVAATLEELIFKQQAFLVKHQSELRRHLGEEAIAAYNLSIKPQLHGTGKLLFDEFKAFLSTLQTPKIDSQQNALEALELLNKYFPQALKVSREYLELLKARKQLNRKPHTALPHELEKMIIVTDRKLKRRLRLRRTILEQFYALRLLLVAWTMQQTRKDVDEHIEKRQKLGTRLTSLRIDIEEIERKWSKTPGNRLLTSRLSELRTAFDRAGSEIKALEAPFQRHHLDEWLSGIVDYRLLRERNDRLRKLNRRSIEAIAYLIRIHLEIEKIASQQLHEAKTMRPVPLDINANISKEAQKLVTVFFEKRKTIKETPYWIPEVLRNKKTKKVKLDIIEQLKTTTAI